MLAGGETVLVAVSGGADSVALLHLLLGLASEWRLRLHVLHVDHQLRAGSAADADFVRKLGARLGVPVDVATVAVARQGSLEAAARAARYAALETCAERIGAARIAVGHTADDQAETVLMRLMQGAGVRGLSGIPPVRGPIIRPLIELRRSALEAELRAGRALVGGGRDQPGSQASPQPGPPGAAPAPLRDLQPRGRGGARARGVPGARDRAGAGSDRGSRAGPAGGVGRSRRDPAARRLARPASSSRRRGLAPGRGPPRQPGSAARVGAPGAQARASRSRLRAVRSSSAG